MTKQIEEMTDKMPDIKKTMVGLYIAQDSINVPDGLSEAIRRSEHVETVSTKSPIFMALLQAARELQRLKGLK